MLLMRFLQGAYAGPDPNVFSYDYPPAWGVSLIIFPVLDLQSGNPIEFSNVVRYEG